MKRYRTYPDETTFYYSTCTIINWLPVFQEDDIFQIIINSLKYCQEHKGLILHGYVVMPNHLHLITSHNQDTSLADIMRDFKHFTSSEISRALEERKRVYFLSMMKRAAEKRSLKQTYKVWQDEYHPIALKSEKWFVQKLQYMHNNPVRKGFVEIPEHWKYSSARNWFHDDQSIIEISKLDGVFSFGAETP